MAFLWNQVVCENVLLCALSGFLNLPGLTCYLLTSKLAPKDKVNYPEFLICTLFCKSVRRLLQKILKLFSQNNKKSYLCVFWLSDCQFSMRYFLATSKKCQNLCVFSLKNLCVIFWVVKISIRQNYALFVRVFF